MTIIAYINFFCKITDKQHVTIYYIVIHPAILDIIWFPNVLQMCQITSTDANNKMMINCFETNLRN